MSRINLVSKRAASPSPWNGILVCVPLEGIPFYLSALWLRSQKYWWEDGDSAKNGRQLMNEMGVHMLRGCGKDIVEAVNRVYMLIDRNENGTQYSSSIDEETGEIIISPPIPEVPPLPALYSYPGSKWQTEDLRDMLLNAITGATTADYANPRGTNPVLEEILLALQAETNEENIELLQKILLALGGAI